MQIDIPARKSYNRDMRRAGARRVRDVEYLGGLSYQVTFDDGVAGEVDLIDFILLGPLYKPLEDATRCSQARGKDGAMTWPGGFTFYADTLYDNIMWNRRSKTA